MKTLEMEGAPRDDAPKALRRMAKAAARAFRWLRPTAAPRRSVDVEKIRFASTARRLLGSDPRATRMIMERGIDAELGTSLGDDLPDCRIAGTMESVPASRETDDALAFLGDAFYEAGITQILRIRIDPPPAGVTDRGKWLERHEVGPALRHLEQLGYQAAKIRALKEQADEVTPSARLRSAP